MELRTKLKSSGDSKHMTSTVALLKIGLVISPHLPIPQDIRGVGRREKGLLPLQG
jgi:hypothetical protein